MIRNYLIIALRNLLRQKGYSIINISGLAIGLAAFILIVLFVVNELSYDKFHTNADRIYRISVEGIISGDVLNVAVSAAPTGEAMVRDIPEILKATRIDKFAQTVHFNYQDKKFFQDGLIYVDSTFFDIFSFKLIRGNPSTALVKPFSLVLTESLADKYFGDEDPMGKSIRLNDKTNFTVTGIVEDPPVNSHFKFEVLSSFVTQIKTNGKEAYEHWGALGLHTYVLLAKSADPRIVEKQFPDMYLKYMEDLSELENIKFNPYLQPITEIHLHSNLMAELETNGDISNVYTFFAIAIFILLIACINFMNLSTARSMKRAREVGLRKVVGAFRKQLIFQFIGESLILSIISLIFALILVEISLPIFNELLSQNLVLGLFQNGYVLLYLLGLAIVVGFVAGSYPAFYLSAFQPIKVLKGTLSKSAKKPNVRNVLVIIQFAISVFLIICTGLLYNQLSFLQQKKLGFNTERVIILPLRGDRLREKASILKSEFSNLSCVSNVSTSRFVPGRDMDGSGYVPEGYDDNNPIIVFNNGIDQDYLETMQMEIAMGRNFSREFSTDSTAVIINETLVKKLGWENPLGKKITSFRDDTPVDLNVIGVVKDFHFRSLHAVIEPSLMYISQRPAANLNIRLHPGNVQQNLESIREKWQEIEANMPFDYYFLEEDFNSQYKAEQRIGEIFIYFTIIAIFIACLGLFGLASYNAEQKRKEIGIRKALGSSVQRIVFMLSKQYTKWVVVANIIAWPLAWYFMSDWLGNFAYSINIIEYWWIFIMSALVAIIIAVLTVTYQAIKAAFANPVEAMKYE